MGCAPRVQSEYGLLLRHPKDSPSAKPRRPPFGGQIRVARHQGSTRTEHISDMPTIRPSDFPEEDFWTTEEQTMARRAVHRDLPAHIVPRYSLPCTLRPGAERNKTISSGLLLELAEGA